MRLKVIEEKYFVKANIEETQSRVQKALEAVGLSSVAVKKSVPPRYLLMEYSPGWVGKTFEIEFLFTKTDGGTEVAIKWPYTKELPAKNETPTEFRRHQEETRRRTESLIEEFKRRIGASDAPAVSKSS
ncbi:MAG: hypothetical protein ACE14S_01840 [Candidatus Bathyarchaeia archaeon]